MPIDLVRCRKLLDTFDLDALFVEVLGWDRHKATLKVATKQGELTLKGFAEKRGFAAFICDPGTDGRIPDHAVRAQIDREVTKSAREHIIIYANKQRTEQVWQWVRRGHGADGQRQPLKRREFNWRNGQASGLLVERVMPSICFSLGEEEKLTLPEVTSRASAAFDVEKVTKKFFERFQTEHKAFHKFIEGIEGVADRDWYASVMLNRLMFCYFIQKKGLLDGDHDYLRNRLGKLQSTKGKDKFWSFYRQFLLRLFHEGLSTKANQRAKELDALIGKIPYLNGGLFDVHELETKHKDIKIPDSAFERLFKFFDEYTWHLDDRPLTQGNEINPDVLGYIFEKYINQKQMGAYYTKEDITEYISKNTIIPFILDQAAENCAIAFKASESGSVWRLLKNDPDRYIYDAVLHGVVDEQGKVVTLPAEIEAGVKDVAKRGGWNKPAAAPFALPTETWREHVARRQRCLELREKLAKGEVQTVNDLVTLNLDIRQFAEDVIVNAEGPDLLRAVWKAVESVTVLDPTCGSGAFLFAALNILEPLYEACLDGMESFLDDLKRAEAAGEKVHADKFKDFKEILRQVELHPNTRYFILKSIIVSNLYGVDIMEEACEICKLRLFLKLVAQVEEGVGGIEKIEPLPDIDFNIRAGNTLVGYSSLEHVRETVEGLLPGLADKEVKRIESQTQLAATAFALFRSQQVHESTESAVLRQTKVDLKKRLEALDADLDAYLASAYGVDSNKPKSLANWQRSHEPFHWFVDFFAIMEKGGFDVIVGNPPYVNAAKVRKQYKPFSVRTGDAPDIYAWVMERSASLLNKRGRMGMIVPLSLGFSRDFDSLRSVLYGQFDVNWFSSFGRIPSALFSFDVRVRNTIHLGCRTAPATEHGAWTSRLHRWFDVERPFLLPRIQYARFKPTLWGGRVPKFGEQPLIEAFERRLSLPYRLAGDLAERETPHRLYFKATAYNWLNYCPEMPPCFDAKGNAISHTQFGDLAFRSEEGRLAATAILDSKLVFLLWAALGDDFHVTTGLLKDIPASIGNLERRQLQTLIAVGKELEKRLPEAVSFKVNAGKKVGNYNLAMCRATTDKADVVLLELMGLTAQADLLETMYSQIVRTDFEEDEE